MVLAIRGIRAITIAVISAFWSLVDNLLLDELGGIRRRGLSLGALFP
jgi:hypothetical protein